MALLSQMIRTVAITGDARRANAWFADRQGKEWTERTVRAALPYARGAAAPADAGVTLAKLTELRDRRAISDQEMDLVRARLRI